MIFITPNTIRSPVEMINNSAPVVTASRATVSMTSPEWWARGRCYRLRTLAVIASEAKQSRATHTTLDCFVASLLAMTILSGLPRDCRFSQLSRFRRALCARIDAREALDHADPSVGLDLAEIHGERGVPLLVHLDRAARPVDRHFGERLQHLGLIRSAGFLDRGLVSIDRLVFRHRQIVRRLQVGAELLAHGREEGLVRRCIDAGDIGRRDID